MQKNRDVFITTKPGTSQNIRGHYQSEISGPYHGPSYSVKYLGIVDGSMGVLSRKMALKTYDQAK